MKYTIIVEYRNGKKVEEHFNKVDLFRQRHKELGQMGYYRQLNGFEWYRDSKPEERVKCKFVQGKWGGQMVAAE